MTALVFLFVFGSFFFGFNFFAVGSELIRWYMKGKGSSIFCKHSIVLFFPCKLKFTQSDTGSAGLPHLTPAPGAEPYSRILKCQWLRSAL